MKPDALTTPPSMAVSAATMTLGSFAINTYHNSKIEEQDIQDEKNTEKKCHSDSDLQAREADENPEKKLELKTSASAPDLQNLAAPAVTSWSSYIYNPFSPLMASHTTAPLPAAKDYKDIKSVYEIGGRHYEFEDDNAGETASLFSIGCHGEKGDGVPQIVAAMNASIANKRYSPFAVQLLGDNFYNHGVMSWQDPRFNTQFAKQFCNPQTPHIYALPVLACDGNHDENRENETYYVDGGKKKVHNYTPTFVSDMIGQENFQPRETGEDVALNQVLYTYLQTNEGRIEEKSDCEAQSFKERIKLFNQNKINTKALPHWSMPFFYYAYTKSNMCVIVLNSNTLIADALRYYSNVNQHNQIHFLLETYQAATRKGHGVIICQHHPGITVGSRAYKKKWDYHLYLTKDEMKKYDLMSREILTSKGMADGLSLLVDGYSENWGDHSEMIRRLFLMLDIHPNLFLNAHDHFGAVHYTDKSYQVTNGLGTETKKLHHRDYFGGSSLAGFIRETGFVALSWQKSNPTLIQINFHTVTGKHLCFTNKTRTAIHQPFFYENMERRKIENMVRQVCKTYEEFLDAKQREFSGYFFNSTYNWKHTKEDVDGMHQILNLFDEYAPIDLQQLKTQLKELIDKLPNKTSEHSFYAHLKRVLAGTIYPGDDKEWSESQISALKYV